MQALNTKRKPLFDAREFLTRTLDAYSYDLGVLSQDTPFHKAARDRWIVDFKKKFLLSNDRMTREDLAYAKFLRVNDEMGELKTYFDDKTSSHKLVKLEKDYGQMEDDVLSCAKHLISHVLSDSLDPEAVYLKCKNSLGSSVGVPFWDTSPERKFRYPISLTQSLEHVWEHYLTWDHDLAQAIDALNEVEGNNSPATVFTQGSRGCTVPKTDDIDRFISVEPVINMFFQHGLSAVMEDQLKKVGLSFDKDPELHRRWACFGSITNRLATVDFSSMSDRVSLAICRVLLPESWYEALSAVRSPVSTVRGQEVNLNMISTMGNATTFPLETLILWAIAVSTVQYHHSKYKKIPVLARGKKCKLSPYADAVSVFGDDCILERQYVPAFLKVCEYAGFQANNSKTFFGDEYFRESCGGDFYHGRDVRPFFLGAFPERQSKVQMEAYFYSTINGVIRKYISYFGTVGYIYDKKLLKYLLQCLMSVTDKVKFVPENFPEDSGITQLNEIRRFQSCYRGLKTSPISVNRNGMLDFSYLRYLYPETMGKDDNLRYAINLKMVFSGAQVKCTRNELPEYTSKRPEVRKLRRGGKYVHAKSRGVVSMTTPTTLRKRESGK